MRREEKELGKKSVTAFTGLIAGQIFAVLVTIVSGRLLGADIYGQMIYGLTLMNFFALFAKMGFGESLISYISRGDLEPGQKRQIAAFCIKASAAVSVLLTVLLYACRGRVMYIAGSKSITMPILSMMFPFIFLKTVTRVMAGIIRGQKEIRKYYMVTQIIGNGINLIMIPALYFIFRIDTVCNLIIAFYAGYLAELAYCLYYYVRAGFYGKEKKRYSPGAVVGFSVPFLLTGVVGMLNTEIDKYMVGFFLVSSQVAIYSTAVNVGNLAGFTLEAVNSIFAPTISELHYSGRTAKLKGLYSAATKWILSVNTMFLGMVLVFADDIMRLAGEEFAAGGKVLRIVIVGQVAHSAMGSVSYINCMTGHPKRDMYASVIAVLTNICLNCILLPRYGLTGVGAATAASLVVQRAVNFIWMYRELRIHPYNRKYMGIGLAFLIGVPVLLLLKRVLKVHFLVRLILCGAVYTAVYGAVIYTAVCDREEKGLLKGFIQKSGGREAEK